MKKSLIIFLLMTTMYLPSEAKDYAKMHMKQMKKNQEYRIDTTYIKETIPTKQELNLDIKDPKLIKLTGYEDISAEKLKAKLAKDNIEYQKVSKYLASKKLNEYHMQAYR